VNPQVVVVVVVLVRPCQLARKRRQLQLQSVSFLDGALLCSRAVYSRGPSQQRHSSSHKREALAALRMVGESENMLSFRRHVEAPADASWWLRGPNRFWLPLAGDSSQKSWRWPSGPSHARSVTGQLTGHGPHHTAARDPSARVVRHASQRANRSIITSLAGMRRAAARVATFRDAQTAPTTSAVALIAQALEARVR